LAFELFAKGINSNPLIPYSVVPNFLVTQRANDLIASFGEILPISNDCRLLVPPFGDTFESSLIAVTWSYRNGIFKSQATIKYLMPGFWECQIHCLFASSNGTVTKQVASFSIKSVDETELLHSPDGLNQTVYDVFFGSRTITSRVSRFLETHLPFLKCTWGISSLLINKKSYPFVDFNITLDVPISIPFGNAFVACSAQSHVFVIKVSIRKLPRQPATILQNSVSTFYRTALADSPSEVSVALQNMVQVLNPSRMVISLAIPNGSQYFGSLLEITSSAALTVLTFQVPTIVFPESNIVLDVMIYEAVVYKNEAYLEISENWYAYGRIAVWKKNPTVISLNPQYCLSFTLCQIEIWLIIFYLRVKCLGSISILAPIPLNFTFFPSSKIDKPW